MAYRELGVEHEIGRVGIFVTNKIIIYTFFLRKHIQRQHMLKCCVEYSKCAPKNTISSKIKLSPALASATIASLYAMKDCSLLFIAVSTQQVLGLLPMFSCLLPYWLDDNYYINKLGCDWIQAFVL